MAWEIQWCGYMNYNFNHKAKFICKYILSCHDIDLSDNDMLTINIGRASYTEVIPPYSYISICIKVGKR